MARPSNRAVRRHQLARAFLRVLAERGVGGATIVAVATEADVAPGLLHHHFTNKADLYAEGLRTLMASFRERQREQVATGVHPLTAHLNAALSLDGGVPVEAKAWVGVLAEAVRDPALFDLVRRAVDGELQTLRRLGTNDEDAAALLAFVVGALVLGAFAPSRVHGFARPALARWLRLVRADAT